MWGNTMDNEKNNIEVSRLISKGIEAFILGLEIYNKPTILYRIEGFSFFIVNAWELILKARLIDIGESIYYKDKPDRTLSLSEAIGKIYSDKHTRIRLNLEKIIELRNISTHYITDDYEAKYAPLFQACVLNFISEIKRFHDVDITKHIAQNFLTLSASYEPLSNEQIKIKYPPEIAEKFIMHANDVEVLTKEFNSDKFAIGIRQNLYITKKRGESDFSVRISKDANAEVAIVKELKDPGNTHPYSFKNVALVVSERIRKLNIKLGYEKGFTTNVLTSVINFYDVKLNEKYSFKHIIGNQEYYTYSEVFIDFILIEIQKNPENFVKSLKK